MIFMKIVSSSVGSGVQNLMYSFLFLMIGGTRVGTEVGSLGGSGVCKRQLVTRPFYVRGGVLYPFVSMVWVGPSTLAFLL